MQKNYAFLQVSVYTIFELLPDIACVVEKRAAVGMEGLRGALSTSAFVFAASLTLPPSLLQWNRRRRASAI